MTKPDDRAQDAHPEAMPNDEALDGEQLPEDDELDQAGIAGESAEPGEGERPKALIPHACTIPSREPHRSLTVAPLIGNQRCYGEATVRLACVSWETPNRLPWFLPC